MRDFDQNLLNMLIDLKENHSVIGVKTEFETEGTSFEEAEKLRKLVVLSNLNFTTKIGGCGALNDILNAKKINTNSIVAPMIESEYALEKFIQTIKTVYNNEEINNLNLFINIETITGINNLEKIMNSNALNYIQGIILGRNDLISSMNRDKSFVNSEEILKITNSIAKELEKKNKVLIIGGCIDEKSLNFFNKITSSSFIGFETRKIVFKYNSEIKEQSILKAIEFEINWLKNKTDKTGFDIKRINYLENILAK